MKIIQINAVNKIASTGRTSFEMSSFLSDAGHSCITAYSQGQPIKPDIEYKIGSRLDAKIHGLFSRIFGKQGYFSYASTRKLCRFMDEYKPDIVVLRNLHANYINLPILLKYLAKRDIATVAVLHDCWFYTGKCCHYTVQGCYKWKEKCGNCPQLKKHNKSWLFDRTRAMLKNKKKLFGLIPRLAVVGVSDWIVNEAKQAPVFQNAKILRKIYNWVDTETFSYKSNTQEIKARLGLENKKIILCIANIWNRDKGLDTVSQIAQKLSDDEKLVLVGKIGNYEIDENILHIEWTDSAEELAEYYSMADVFVQPSLEETFGKVTAESLSCGTPVVCFNSTTTPELVNEKCGIVVDSFDTDSMLNAIREVLEKGKDSYFEECRKTATGRFSKEKSLTEYAKLFEEVLS